MACAALKRPHNFDLLNGNTPSDSIVGTSPKRRRCGTILSNLSPPVNPSAFFEATPKYCRDDLTRNIHDEWRRIQKRRKLVSPPSSPSCSLKTHKTGFQGSLNSQSTFWSFSLPKPSESTSPESTSPRSKEQGTFTVKQVVSLCERLWKEREDKLREEYDQVLNDRLSEQYDSFLKFTQDQIMRKYHQSSCSYVS